MGWSTNSSKLAGPAAWTPSPSIDQTVAHSAEGPASHSGAIRWPEPFSSLSDRPRRKRKDHQPTSTPISLNRRVKQRKARHSPSARGRSPPTRTAQPLSPVSTSRPSFPPLQRLPGPCFRQKFFQGKGFGLQATRNLTRGEEIVREAPFVTFRFNESDIHKAFHALSDTARILFLSFNRTINDPDWSLLGNIAETNALNCWNEDDEDDEDDEDEGDEGGEAGEEQGDDGVLVDKRVGGSSNSPIDLTGASDEETGKKGTQLQAGRMAGLFENICRINHSCRPNAGWAWDTSTGQMVLYAYNNISANEEITASYQTAYNILPRAERRVMLAEKFGFDCLCPTCSPVDAGSEARLAEFRRIREWFWPEIARRRQSSPTQEEDDEDQESFAIDRGLALYRLDRAMEILEAEHQFTFQGDILVRRFTVYVIWGERAKARQAAEAVFQHTRIHRGMAFAKTTAMNEWRRCPETHRLWDVGRKYYGHMSTSDDGDSDFEDHFSKSHRQGKKRSKVAMKKDNPAATKNANPTATTQVKPAMTTAVNPVVAAETKTQRRVGAAPRTAEKPSQRGMSRRDQAKLERRKAAAKERRQWVMLVGMGLTASEEK